MARDRKAYFKAYYQKHREEFLKYSKLYYQSHPKEQSILSRKWQLSHPEKEKENKKIWKMKHPEYFKLYSKTPKGRVHSQRHMAKRERMLGFIPLNNWFKNSEGHHIDKENVIYIPKELHRSIPHSVIKNINMAIINKKAMQFLQKGLVGL